MNKCYEEFSNCMERSAINTANAVFVGDDVSQEYRGYVFIKKCISLNLIIYWFLRINILCKITHVFISGNTKPRPKCTHIIRPSKTKIKYANQYLRYA